MVDPNVLENCGIDPKKYDNMKTNPTHGKAAPLDGEAPQNLIKSGNI